jgi:hypothetical protein
VNAHPYARAVGSDHLDTQAAGPHRVGEVAMKGGPGLVVPPSSVDEPLREQQPAAGLDDSRCCAQYSALRLVDVDEDAVDQLFVRLQVRGRWPSSAAGGRPTIRPPRSAQRETTQARLQPCSRGRRASETPRRPGAASSAFDRPATPGAQPQPHDVRRHHHDAHGSIESQQAVQSKRLPAEQGGASIRRQPARGGEQTCRRAVVSRPATLGSVHGESESEQPG